VAGVRKKAQPNGKYVAWFMDMHGKQKFFTGTMNKHETGRMAERLEDEHRQIRLGYRPAPKSSDKHRSRSVTDTSAEYLAWGESQGGRGKRAWGKDHARKRRTLLKWWEAKLGLATLTDFDGVLPRFEAALRELQGSGKSGKTLQNYREALCAFCDWAVKRGYLAEDPLKASVGFDTTPKVRRRAMTAEEIQQLLKVCGPQRRLLYEVAFCSGLRAGEIRSLTVRHLDTQAAGLQLDSAWTKNRKPAFQPLPRSLVERLAAEAQGKTPDAPLLSVPKQTARAMKADLEAAGIPRWTPEGKLDFHACRVAYVSFILESGASAKEAQALARHSTADLTMNVYAKARHERLSEVTEAVGRIVISGPDNADCRTRQAVGAECVDITPIANNGLRAVETPHHPGFDSPRLHH
jgi:integrase